MMTTFLASLAGGLLAAVTVLWALGFWSSMPATSSPWSAPAAAPQAASAPPAYLTHYRESLAALPNAAPDLKAAARRATPVTVHITARPNQLPKEAVKRLVEPGNEQRRSYDGEGSGVIYRAGGYIITNYHVVRDAGDIIVRTSNRRSYPAEVVGFDRTSDLAVLKIEGDRFPTLSLADSDAVQPGTWVLAVGSPLGLSSTVTAGIVSAKGRNINLIPELDAIESFIQTDAAVNPGNSGGPLVTGDGKLLGINTAIASQTGRFQGYSFAIPINLVQRIADDIIEFGSYRRAFLGVGISTLTERDVERLGLGNRTEGVVIDEILAGGSAAAAGLLAGDVVINVGNRRIRDLPDLTEIVGRSKVGETLNVTVVRNGTPLEVIVPMLAFPE